MTRRVSIPVAPMEYSQSDQSQARRITEIEIQQAFNDIERNETKKSKDGSLALRRYQFMFMGVNSG